MALALGTVALAAGWIAALLLGDQRGIWPALAGSLAFVVAFAWPGLVAWARSLGDGRRVADAVASGRVGEAVVERLTAGTLRVNGARLCDLDLLVREPGRPEFRARVSAFVDPLFAPHVQPGAVVRVGRPHPDRDEVVLLP